MGTHIFYQETDKISGKGIMLQVYLEINTKETKLQKDKESGGGGHCNCEWKDQEGAQWRT